MTSTPEPTPEPAPEPLPEPSTETPTDTEKLLARLRTLVDDLVAVYRRELLFHREFTIIDHAVAWAAVQLCINATPSQIQRAHGYCDTLRNHFPPVAQKACEARNILSLLASVRSAQCAYVDAQVTYEYQLRRVAEVAAKLV